MTTVRYGCVPRSVPQNTALSEGARLLYVELLVLPYEDDGAVLATYAQLAEHLGVSEAAIKRRVRALAAAGLLGWKRGRRGQPNRYELKEIVPRSRPARRTRPDLPGRVEAGPLSVGAEVLAVPAQEATELEDDVAVLDAEDSGSAGVGTAEATRDAARPDTSRARVGLGIARHDHESTPGGGR